MVLLIIQIGQFSKNYPSCLELLTIPFPTPLKGTPDRFLIKLKESKQNSRQREDLETLLLSVRKLREGLISNERFDFFTIDGM